MVDKVELQDKWRRAKQFLHLAYLKAGEFRVPILPYADIKEELAFTDEEINDARDRLFGRRYIKQWAVGNGSFQLTHTGFKEAENDLKEGEWALTTIESNDQSDTLNNLTSDEMQEIVSGRQRQRAEFLNRLYEESGGLTWKMIPIRDIALPLGISENEALGVIQYLEDEFYLKQETLGGFNGSVSITEYGIQLVEYSIMAESSDDDDSATEEPTLPADFKGFPKTPRIRKKWAEAWSIIKYMRKEYYSDESLWDEPEPTIKDIQDRLHTHMNWKPGHSTIGRIKRAGEAGMLDEYLPQ